jgi:type III restriction enzyme
LREAKQSFLRIGRLWASLSGGRCRFVMLKDKRWDWIEEKLT